jgi:deoxyribodipyrimidine photo-lyase
MNTVLVWFRRDLRVADNPALMAALAADCVPLPVYVHDTAASLPGAAGSWWLHHSLAAHAAQLQAMGSRLVIADGDTATALVRLAKACNATRIFFNRSYEPHLQQHEAAVTARLQQQGITLHGCHSQLLYEPHVLLKADATPYRVFTPFWKALQKLGPVAAPLAAPEQLPAPPDNCPASLPLQQLGLLPDTRWHRKFHAYWQPGEAAAGQALQRHLDNSLRDYPEDRDRPDLPGTSRLSPYLHFGEIGARQIWYQVQHWALLHNEAGLIRAADTYLRQLGWREFAAHLLFHFPETVAAPMNARFATFPWATDYADQLRRWQGGTTGIPIVDAGMRELWETGWMHNRVRMIVASLLTKNLLIPWQEGAHWFRDTLLDADLANNTLGWQWVAGCGADAAPYFRVFNPVRQGERFDPDGSYVRRWVPELAGLPARYIHHPWDAPDQLRQQTAAATGSNYPEPLVDLHSTRERALQRYKDWKQRA